MQEWLFAQVLPDIGHLRQNLRERSASQLVRLRRSLNEFMRGFPPDFPGEKECGFFGKYRALGCVQILFHSRGVHG